MAVIQGQGFRESQGFYKNGALAAFLAAVVAFLVLAMAGAVLILLRPSIESSQKQCTSSIPLEGGNTGIDLIKGGTKMNNDEKCCDHCAAIVGSVMWEFDLFASTCFCKGSIGAAKSCGAHLTHSVTCENSLILWAAGLSRRTHTT